MNILIKAYSNLNVGDDLYLHIVFRRYPEHTFTLIPNLYFEKYVKIFSTYQNVRVERSRSDFVGRVMARFGHPLLPRQLKEFDGCIYIGGSIFIENPDNHLFDDLLRREVSYFARHGKPYFILSCNFGPYYHESFRQEKEMLFLKCADVCFRDQKSYDLFSSLSQTRLAADAVFLYPVPHPEKKRAVGFSLADLSARPAYAHLFEQYFSYLKQAAQDAIEKGYEIYLFSYCSAEGDERVADLLADAIPACHKVSYTGDMDSFLQSYLSMSYTINTRLHGVVLSSMAGIPTIALSYTDKIRNLMQDLSLPADCLDLNTMRLEKASQKTLASDVGKDAEKIFTRTDIFMKS